MQFYLVLVCTFCPELFVREKFPSVQDDVFKSALSFVFSFKEKSFMNAKQFFVCLVLHQIWKIIKVDWTNEEKQVYKVPAEGAPSSYISCSGSEPVSAGLLECLLD